MNDKLNIKLPLKLHEIQRVKPPFDLVWVDPQDDAVDFWWPAVVIPREEYHNMKEVVSLPKSLFDSLVCYFEDGSL